MKQRRTFQKYKKKALKSRDQNSKTEEGGKKTSVRCVCVRMMLKRERESGGDPSHRPYKLKKNGRKIDRNGVEMKLERGLNKKIS